MGFRYQNLNDGHGIGRYWLHGRCWWRSMRLEWAIPAWGSSWGLQLTLASEDAAQVRVGLGLFVVYLSTQARWHWILMKRVMKSRSTTNGRQIGISVHGAALRVRLWADPMDWRSADPKWWSFSVDFADLFLGKRTYNSTELSSGEVDIHMPEGAYAATYKVKAHVWKRPRWFALKRTDVWFDIPAGIPEEGKGESDYDLDMDATFGIGTEWKGNIHDAAKKIALRCLGTRSRRGSLSSPAYGEWRRERLERLAAE